MEKLSKRRKYLKTIFSSHALIKDGQHLLQTSLTKANSDISIFELCSIHNKASNQASPKAEMKTSSNKYYHNVT